MNQKREFLKYKNGFQFALIASLTLGLAPYFPEPHLVGKIRWLLGGGEGMQWIDYGDLLMHGAPWLLLIYFSIRWMIEIRRGNLKSR